MVTANIHAGKPLPGKHSVKMFVILAILVLAPLVLLVLDGFEFIRLPEKTGNYLLTGTVVFLSLLAAKIFLKYTEDRVFRFMDDELEIEQRIFFTKVYRFGVYSLALTVIFSHLGLSLQGMAIYLGLLSTGVAFAIKDVLLSSIVWLVILLKKPFRMGDYIVFNSFEGVIVKIGTYFLTLDTLSLTGQRFIKVPNKIVLDQPIINHGSSGTIIDTMILNLDELPPDYEKKLKAVERAVAGVSGVKGPLLCFYDSVGGFLQVKAIFAVEAALRSGARSRIVAILSREFGKWVARPPRVRP